MIRNEAAAKEIINIAVISLSAEESFFSYPLGVANPTVTDSDFFVATDGKGVYFGEKSLFENAVKFGEKQITLGLCHTILHDLFLHPLIKPDNAELYDLACDITVGYYVDYMDIPFGDRRATEQRKAVYKSIINDFGGVTERLCETYLADKGQSETEKLKEAFTVCDHSMWKDKKGGGNAASGDNNENDDGDDSETEKQWVEISKRIIPMIGKERKDLKRKLENVTGSKRDYRKFLERFLKTSERKTPSEDFDYIYYCYGLSMYKNVPLIERLETSDKKDYSQIVIAIDVSGSTAGEPVKKFVAEVYAICREISKRDELRLRIIQCDLEIRSDEIIKGDKEFEEKMRNFKLLGGGGTDFRPVFERLDADRKRSAKIRALLYFTDGLGVFPTENPDYKTCFLLYGENADEVKTPYFAYKIILDKEDLE